MKKAKTNPPNPPKPKPKPEESDDEFYRRQQFFLAPDMIDFLEKESYKINRSRGSIVRAAIRLYAKQYQIALMPERLSASHRRYYGPP